MVRRTKVVPYDPDWPNLFKIEVDRIAAVLGQEVVAIHHIGSTAIPNISAKPIIDMLVEAQDIEKIDDFNGEMTKRGYRPQGEFGIPGRRFFIKGGDATRTHHIHVFQTGNPRIDRHLDFRDYMLAHPEEAQVYSRLKEELAQRFPQDIEGYMAGKDGLIKETDRRAKAWRESLKRTYHAEGSPREVGFALGQALGERLEGNIARYIETGPARHGVIDRERLRNGALPWLRSLPQRYQDEFEGLAEGANVPLQRLAEWCFVEECVQDGCSALVCLIEGSAWVARNNDMWAPDLWGYVTIREVDGRIPRIDFGLEGELFTGTGINGEQLWLHYNWLPVIGQDAPQPGKPHMACFVWLTEALETCRSIDDVESLLRQVNRHGGMMLFAVDGKTDEFAVFECTCTTHFKRELSRNWIVGTNHYRTAGAPELDDPQTESRRRFERIEELLQKRVGECDGAMDVPRALMGILADPGVEVRGEDYGTVYANVVCPSQCVVWYTFGGYPAASAGAWYLVEWPWERDISKRVVE